MKNRFAFSLNLLPGKRVGRHAPILCLAVLCAGNTLHLLAQHQDGPRLTTVDGESSGQRLFADALPIRPGMRSAEAGRSSAASVAPVFPVASVASMGLKADPKLLLASASDSDSDSAKALPEDPYSASFVAAAVDDASSLGEDPQQQAPTPEIATVYTKVIQPGVKAPPLSAGDKILLGMRSATSAKAATGWVFASLYEQAFDRGPNYGQTAKGFLQRIGASVARDTSETIFSDSVMAPILHEDPRYYRMGPGHNAIVRILYAGTRTLVTRTDGGTLTPNFSLVAGNLAGAALTQAYYPARNTGFGPTMSTFGDSLLGSSAGLVVDEFFRDALALLHINRTQ